MSGLEPTRPMSTPPASDGLVDGAARVEQLPVDLDGVAEGLLEQLVVLHDEVAVGHVLVADGDRVRSVGGALGARRPTVASVLDSSTAARRRRPVRMRRGRAATRRDALMDFVRRDSCGWLIWVFTMC